MRGISLLDITEHEARRVLQLDEGHFVDVKAIEITPSRLTKTISALSNAEGGELYVGIDEPSTGVKLWRGFESQEHANGHLQAFEALFPLGDGYSYTFLRSPIGNGLVLKVDVAKARDVKSASNGKVYIRRGAQNLPLTTPEELDRLRRNKGIVSFESETVSVATDFITNSIVTIRFMLEVVPTSEPEPWLKKQQMLVGDKPTVAAIVLFADEPQAILAKRAGIKIYRYRTQDAEGTRDTLAFDPISVDGCAYEQIAAAVGKTVEIVQSVRVSTPSGMQKVEYPSTALHEIITNAVLHRDYSIADDIHIRVFDNRIEVASPGTLPGHITPENILSERFARNGSIVRLVNKFPNPPNKDVGEGLNTAFSAMRELKLRDPLIEQLGGYVVVTLKHERLGTPEELILEYLQDHDQIRNREARDICYIGSENRMKTILQRMVKNEILELVPGTTRYTAAYKLKR